MALLTQLTLTFWPRPDGLRPVPRRYFWPVPWVSSFRVSLHLRLLDRSAWFVDMASDDLDGVGQPERRLNRGLHSVWRGKLNRLMRGTNGYIKSIDMLVYSLALV